MSRQDGGSYEGDDMRITRNLFAIAALAAFSAAYAGDAGKAPGSQTTSCAEPRCSMDMAPVATKTTVASTPSSWYLPTWEEASASTRTSETCDAKPCTMGAMGAAQLGNKAATTSASSWYLPTWEEASATTNQPGVCDMAHCSMAGMKEDKKAPSEKPIDSWYLPS